MNKAIIALILVAGVAYLGLTAWYVDHRMNDENTGGSTPTVSFLKYTTQSAVSVPFGGSVSVLSTSTSAQYRRFQNQSGNTVFLACGDMAAASSTGIMLTASSTLEMRVDDGSLCTGAIRALGWGAAANLLVQEY